MITATGVQKIMAFGLEMTKSGISSRRACLFGTSLILLGLSGCGEGLKPWEKVVPASGQVTFQGQPVEGAQIILVPVSTEVPATVRPSATTVAGGNFILGTYGSADGAPAGEYKVSAVWFKTVNSGGSMVRGDNVLPGKYADANTSGITVVINEEETAIPVIELKK